MKINGIVVPQGFSQTLGGAPEDAAKKFLELVGKGFGKVCADAMAGALGEAIGGLGATPDWVQYIKGCAIDLTFDTPPGTPVQNATTIASSSSGPALGSVDISVGVGIHF